MDIEFLFGKKKKKCLDGACSTHFKPTFPFLYPSNASENKKWVKVYEGSNRWTRWMCSMLTPERGQWNCSDSSGSFNSWEEEIGKSYKLFNDRNKPRVNKKRSFIDNPYFFGDAFFVQLYTLSSHFCNNFFVQRQFYQTLLKLPGAFNLQLLYSYNN